MNPSVGAPGAASMRRTASGKGPEPESESESELRLRPQRMLLPDL